MLGAGNRYLYILCSLSFLSKASIIKGISFLFTVLGSCQLNYGLGCSGQHWLSLHFYSFWILDAVVDIHN